MCKHKEESVSMFSILSKIETTARRIFSCNMKFLAPKYPLLGPERPEWSVK
jgi:hypothetical protein